MQQAEWNAARAKGKPVSALLVDPDADWKPSLIEGLGDTDAAKRLQGLHTELKDFTVEQRFDSDPRSIRSIAQDALATLKQELAARGAIGVFVVWDTTVRGLGLILASLQNRPPNGFVVAVPALQEEVGAGEILHDIVLKGIRENDRVLVVTDRVWISLGAGLPGQ